MPAEAPTIAPEIKLDGSLIDNSEANGTKLIDLLISAEVFQSLNAPDMFVLTFRDSDRAVVSGGRFAIGGLVAIKAMSEDNPSGEVLLARGEITAMEAGFEVGLGTTTVIRGYDKLHRLFRGRRSETYLNQSYSDVASRIASNHGLTAQSDPTPTNFPYLVQFNMSDWEYLSGLAREVGFELKVDDASLLFKKPTQASGASTDSSRDARRNDPLQLTLGETLLQFRSLVTAADQVPSVEVRSWDPKGKKEIVGTATAKTDSIALTGAKTPGQMAQLFSAKPYVEVRTPLDNQSDADNLAKSIAKELAGGHSAFEGVARGNGKLKAGTAVSLGMVGSPFDGRYTLTSTHHLIDSDTGYTTRFVASGGLDRSIAALSASSIAGLPKVEPIHGVVIGIVTAIKDTQKTENAYRVKVKFPWLGNDIESAWARVSQPWAGNGYGSIILPEVNDEVLVAFEHGDPTRPYVLGSLYNGVDKPKQSIDEVVDQGTNVERRIFRTRIGHELAFVDKKGEETINVTTGDGKFIFELNQAKTKILAKSDGTVEIEAKGKVTIKSTTDAIELDAGTSMKLSAKQGIEIKAGTNLNMKAASGASLNGGSKVEVKGAQAVLNGSGTTDVTAGGLVKVQGAIVKIN